ncbi:hypothetical protein [Sphingomonas adhaesiva]|uniref:hypothetical protein n=1 Tax=Sphingomonas adhaesiva TaxID=28212 RepID=UPI002FF8B49F
MAIIPIPARLPLRGLKWRCPEPAIVNRSGWTGTSKVVGLPGAGVWSASGEFSVIVGEGNVLRWRAFFTALRGQRNSFCLIAIERARQTETIGVTVRAGAGNADTLPLQGMPAGGRVLLGGELMTVPLPSGHHRLVCLTQDLVADANGEGVARFGPELGEIPTAGTLVELRTPYAQVRQTSEPPGWDVGLGQTYTFPFSVEEAK